MPFVAVFCRNVVIFLVNVQYLAAAEVVIYKNLVTFHTAYIYILFKNTACTDKLLYFQFAVTIFIRPHVDNSTVIHR